MIEKKKRLQSTESSPINADDVKEISAVYDEGFEGADYPYFEDEGGKSTIIRI